MASNDEVFYENDLFKVVAVPVASDDPGGLLDVYGLINKETGVREAETRRLFTAKIWADGMQDQLRHPEKYIPSDDETMLVDGSPRMH